MLQYPGFFTAGTCYKEGPPADMVADQSFSLILDGKGFSPEAEGRKKPDRKIRVKVTGPGMCKRYFLPFYPFTIMVKLSG